jgi:hypothetical protein
MRSNSPVDESGIARAETRHGLFEQFGVAPDTLAIAFGFYAVQDEEEGSLEVSGATYIKGARRRESQ